MRFVLHICHSRDVLVSLSSGHRLTEEACLLLGPASSMQLARASLSSIHATRLVPSQPRADEGVWDIASVLFCARLPPSLLYLSLHFLILF